MGLPAAQRSASRAHLAQHGDERLAARSALTFGTTCLPDPGTACSDPWRTMRTCVRPRASNYRSWPTRPDGHRGGTHGKNRATDPDHTQPLHERPRPVNGRTHCPCRPCRGSFRQEAPGEGQGPVRRKPELLPIPRAECSQTIELTPWRVLHAVARGYALAGGIRPVVVFHDHNRELKPRQVDLEFYNAGDGRWAPVPFKKIAPGESVGAFADFPGFTVPRGRTIKVEVRLAFTSDTRPSRHRGGQRWEGRPTTPG